MRPVWVLGLGLGLWACAGAPRPVRIDLDLRPSCGIASTLYDLSCVRALEVRLVDLEGNVVASQCTPTELGLFDNFSELLGRDEPLFVLEDITPMRDVRFEVRGYHRVLSGADKPACEDLQREELMLWGTSAIRDLTVPDLREVTVFLECRPSCDCGDLDQSCPLALEEGICTPPRGLCRKTCEVHGDCYGGEEADMACIDDRCQPDATGGMCGDCAVDACQIGLACAVCVDPTRCEQPAEPFCALPCPQGDAADPCPAPMSCSRPGAGRYTLLP